MIWESITLMTVIDALIIGAVGYALRVFYHQRRKFPDSATSLGFFALVLGLSAIALFYLFDLATMHLLPLFEPMSKAMAVMEELHLNYHWILTLFAVVAVSIGFGAIGRGVVTITDKHRESESQLKLIIDNVPAGVSYFDKEQRFQFANQRYENLVRMHPSELIGKTLEEAIGKKSYKVAQKYVQRALEGENVSFENTLPAKNGGSISVVVSYVPDFGPGKTVKGFFALVQDITDRKRNEESLAETSALLETTFESMSQGIAVFDADLRLTAFNQRYLDLRDYPKGYISLGMSYEKIVRFNAEQGDYGPGDSIKQVKERLKAARQGKPWRREYTKADGTALAVGFDPIPGGGFVATITDITERKRAEEALHEAHDVLESKVKERTRELQTVTGRLINAQEEERFRIARELHDDFSQRLALLAVEIQRIGQKISEPEFGGAKSMDKLWLQTQELSTDLHRLSHQLHPAILDQLGLGPAIRSHCGEISEQHGIQIKFTEHEVPASISRDIALCLYRTVQEGLRNIVKHSEAKDAKVELTGGPDTIHLRITDRGVGFDPETTKGKGLGLISIEERIRLVHGEMSLQSRPAHGTCIDLRIPWATPDA
ncbi:MAG: PAS-domain containing protein [Gemmatimonadetes bacterium]|nr:PAS-domain containing protein [Gemmatimonadota bacterium]